MTRSEIKRLMRRRRDEPYAEKRIRAMVRMEVRDGKDPKLIMDLLRGLKALREFAHEKSVSLNS